MIRGAGYRDQRIKIYESRDIGEDGVTHTVWRFLYERWGRVDRISSQQTLANQPQNSQHYVSPGQASFDYRVTVPENGLLLTSDKAYFVRGTISLRQLAELKVVVEEVSDAAFEQLEFDSNLLALESGDLILLENGDFIEQEPSQFTPYDRDGMQLYAEI